MSPLTLLQKTNNVIYDMRSLRSPTHKIQKSESYDPIFSNVPFYDDFYVVVQLVHTANPVNDNTYTVFNIEDSLIIKTMYGGDHFINICRQMCHKGTICEKSNYKAYIKIFVTVYDNYCAYIEKVHNWGFDSVGIITIFSKNIEDLIKYIDEQFDYTITLS